MAHFEPRALPLALRVNDSRGVLCLCRGPRPAHDDAGKDGICGNIIRTAKGWPPSGYSGILYAVAAQSIEYAVSGERGNEYPLPLLEPEYGRGNKNRQLAPGAIGHFKDEPPAPG